MKNTTFIIQKSSIALIVLLAVVNMISCKSDDSKTEDLIIETDVATSTSTSHSRNNCDCTQYIEENKSNNLNISLFLDLSDRIENDGTVQKDLGYIRSIANVFTEKVRYKKVVLMHDNMNVYFDPEPENPEISNHAQNLSVEYCAGSKKSDLATSTKEAYQTDLLKVYELALEEGKTNGFNGSNIFRFFQDHVKDYTISDCHHNILVVLTDGYMYDKRNQGMTEGNKTANLSSLNKLKLNGSDWKEQMQSRGLGYIPATTGLENLEVMVLGINSKSTNPYGQDILKEYWMQWLTDMGVAAESIKIEPDAPVRNMERVIEGFINR